MDKQERAGAARPNVWVPKPLEIEAVQWGGGLESGLAIARWLLTKTDRVAFKATMRYDGEFVPVLEVYGVPVGPSDVVAFDGSKVQVFLEEEFLKMFDMKPSSDEPSKA
jgi:hypothetical protein